jgi:transposase-like protein
VFSLSLRDVELILAERGVCVTHESIRGWCRKFGVEFAKRRLRGLQYKPRRLVTDGLRSYGVAHRALLPEGACREFRVGR